MARLIVVSNRVSVPSGDGSKRAGGLEVALRPTLECEGGVWMGWSGKVAPQDRVETRTITRNNVDYVVTDLSKQDHREYYNGFANRVLWPILHYRLDLAEFARRDLSGYMRVNEHFANELDKIIAADDLVWVHDYHLIPIAAALRRRGHGNRLGFFLHVPFPPPEILTALPNHERLIPLLLQYDVVGFQTLRDAENFVRYLMAEVAGSGQAMRVFETSNRQISFNVGGRQTLIGSFPVAIDTREFAEMACRSMHTPLVTDLQKSLVGRALVIGVDRLDYSKGIVQRMEAFEGLLDSQPGWRGKVTYLQITPKNRSELPEYQELEQAASATAGRINGKYGEVSWTPIRYVNRIHSRAALAGLYRTARVGLVTPLRDGMNLVSKEFIAAQDPEDPGALVLSRFAGAAVECPRALLVNPYDTESVTAAIAQALNMSLEERQARHRQLLAAVTENDINKWRRDYLAALAGTGTDETRELAPAFAEMFAEVKVGANHRGRT